LPAKALLGEGQTAKVYLWQEGKVLKVFRPDVSRAEIEAEASATRIAHLLGAGAPAVGNIVEVEGSLGLILERVEGQSMENRAIRTPSEAQEMAILLADIHVHIHSFNAPSEMPSQAKLLHTKVDRSAISPGLRSRISRVVAEPRREASLCHGDLHPANVLLHGTRHTVIDWNDAARGIPALDVARTTVVLLGAAYDGPQSMPNYAEAIDRFHATYINRYFSKAPGTRTQYECLLPVAAAARLSECGEGAKSWLHQLAQQCS
jgi:thiamine kinase